MVTVSLTPSTVISLIIKTALSSLRYTSVFAAVVLISATEVLHVLSQMHMMIILIAHKYKVSILGTVI